MRWQPRCSRSGAPPGAAASAVGAEHRQRSVRRQTLRHGPQRRRGFCTTDCNSGGQPVPGGTRSAAIPSRTGETWISVCPSRSFRSCIKDKSSLTAMASQPQASGAATLCAGRLPAPGCDQQRALRCTAASLVMSMTQTSRRRTRLHQYKGTPKVLTLMRFFSRWRSHGLLLHFYHTRTSTPRPAEPSPTSASAASSARVTIAIR